MNNITIDKLMPTQRQTVDYLTKGKLSVNSISKDKNINSDPELDFNSTILLKNIIYVMLIILQIIHIINYISNDNETLGTILLITFFTVVGLSSLLNNIFVFI